MSDDDKGLHGARLNGYRVRSWGDLVAVATLLAMLMGVVAWGLKLESELNDVRSSYGHRLANLEGRVANGILPRAEERIRSHERRIEHLEMEVDKHVDREHRNRN